jgi:hypothetical protein
MNIQVENDNAIRKVSAESKAAAQMPSLLSRVEVMVENIVGEHGSTLKRAKLFKECFERFETTWGKEALTDEVKQIIRNEVDNVIKVETLADLEQACMVVESKQRFFQIRSDLTIKQGVKVQSVDTTKLTLADETKALFDELLAFRFTLARKEKGATEAELKKVSKFKHALAVRLFEAKQQGLIKPDSQFERIELKLQEWYGIVEVPKVDTNKYQIS